MCAAVVATPFHHTKNIILHFISRASYNETVGPKPWGARSKIHSAYDRCDLAVFDSVGAAVGRKFCSWPVEFQSSCEDDLETLKKHKDFRFKVLSEAGYVTHGV